MKYVFAVVAAVLIASSFAIYASFPTVATDVPTIYWVTDQNPARVEQVRGFHQWLKDNGHTTPDGEPAVHLLLDQGNRDPRKQIIQGVSGVGGDVMDLSSGNIPYFKEIGIIKVVSEAAQRLNFGPDQTHQAILPELIREGGQYGFPCNVYVAMYWVNASTFERFDTPLPSRRWTWDEFEELGKRFVANANRPGQVRTHFFAANVETRTMHRSLGLSVFDETLSFCTLNDPRYVKALERKRKWMYEDRIIPSAADRAGLPTESGYGGQSFQLFNRGKPAMVLSGRHALIGFRQFGALQLSVAEPPHGGFPNTSMGARTATVYVDGNTDAAELFLEYLASERYNMQIVEDADALPPNPKYAQIPEFSKPENYPNEWGVHDAFFEVAQTIAYTTMHSPFVLTADANREMWGAENGYMLDDIRLTAEEAAAQAASRINYYIQRNVAGSEPLGERYREARRRQAAIDARLAAGDPVPEHWIDNAFLLSYRRSQGQTIVAPDEDWRNEPAADASVSLN